MPDNYVVISRDDCSYCTKAKDLLYNKGLSYTEFNISTDPPFKDMLKALGVATVPFIFTKYSIIGGFTELQSRLAGN